MNIQATTPQFGARVKLRNIQKNLKDLGNASAECSINNLPSSHIGSSISTTTGIKLSGSASMLTGSASVAEAAGIDSSGIFPSVMDTAASSLNEGSIGTIQQGPSMLGVLISGIGAFLSRTKATLRLPNGGKLHIN